MYRILLCFFLFLLGFVFNVNGQIQQQQDPIASLIPLKLSPDLRQKVQASSNKDTALALYIVSVANFSSFEQTYKNQLNFKVISRYELTGSVQIQASYQWMEKAMVDANVQYIASARKPFTERELTGFDLSTNKVNLAHRVWPKFNGQGATISIKEQLLDTADMDFIGRYLNAKSASTNLQTHATTMTTIAAGGGNSFITGKGIAWGANISNSDFNNLLPDPLNELQQLKVAIQNHSYGVGIENYYGADASAYDTQLNQDSTLMHVFSAGNMGDKTSNTGIYQGLTGFANLTGSFKMAKNILTVGATDSFNQVIPISSHGPAYDGRLKPELVALGEDGSSGAAAIVSGICLLIRDAFNYYYPSQKQPSSALIKAVLLNSADDVGNPGVDYFSGFGAANAWRALKTMEDGHILQGAVAENQINNHLISLPDNARNLKISICWIDPPSLSNSVISLVNNLDMDLVHVPSATTYLPWILKTTANSNDLTMSATRGLDSLNNVEQITLDTISAGVYQIRVKGKQVVGTTQAYSIAWQYDTAQHFIFTYPVKGNQLLPKKNNIIRWETNLNCSAQIQYKLNTGLWQNISTPVDLSKKYMHWFCPDTIAAVQLRMLLGQFNKYSDTVALAPIISAKTGFNCVDSFLLYWQLLPVKEFQVYHLGKQFHEPLLTTSDTTITFKKSNTSFQIFTIAPILPFNIIGLRGYAFNYTLQQIDCYINGFIADPSGSNKAKLSLQLGTTFQIKRVVFEKLSSAGYEPIHHILPVTDQQINVIVDASKGLNTYRAKIELQNGTIYYSKPEQVLIFAENPYYLFPNPITEGSNLKLMSDDIDDTKFILFDLMGKKILEQKITSYLETIKLPLLPKGIYYATILKSGIRQKTIPMIIIK